MITHHIKTSAVVTECEYEFTNQRSLKIIDITNKIPKDVSIEGQGIRAGQELHL